MQSDDGPGDGAANGRQMGQQMGQQTERQREQQFTYYWYAARQAQEAKEYDRALMLLLLCEQLNPKDAMTQETIGLLYWGTGRNLEAINYLARAFVLDPGHTGRPITVCWSTSLQRWRTLGRWRPSATY